ncbi:helix-turn-helix domain-containing protein [Paenibacillus psychroresistens]|uniref:Helix-turn-helix domain-containing protein n=1 Tax=Paenibacillus psychroresistens TaxID=1778678 RepID=A0A6B8RV44_9BACL|nr:helix-turn-helix domain-containing protein [Paenibacillus psychroresistens]QGQ99807.1 helix-turn-helix domain-containing protein [Paenibacillus psychroresistens]
MNTKTPATHGPVDDDRSGRLIFSLKEIFHFNGEWHQQARRRVVRSHTIVFIREGSGTLTIDGTKYKIEKNKLFLLTPGMLVEVSVDAGIPLETYYLTFTMALSTRSNQAWSVSEVEKIPLINYGEIAVQNWMQVDHMIRRLHEGRDAKTGLLRWKQQLGFEEMLYTLMEEAKTNDEDSNPLYTMERSAIYMDKHYADNIKIDDMARLSGLNASSFSRLFKKSIGMLPSDYLTHVRIERAKEMLQYSKGMREVSQNTGFCDEYYFSRIFKKVVGIPPSIYVKKNWNTDSARTGRELKAVRVAVTYIDEVDHLIALGLLPIAVPNDHNEDHTEHIIPYLQEYLQDAPRIGCEQTISKDLLRKLNPDMIIACRFMRNWGITELDKIASTHYYFWEVDWRNTHRELAKVLGQEEKAERNIEQFNRQVLTARDTMHKRAGGKKFVFLEMTQQGIRVSPYTSNGGWLLFQQLELTPASVVTDNNWNQLIMPEEAAAINADYIIVGRRSGSQQVYNQFMAHSAVRKKKLLEVPRYPWAKGGPIAYSNGINHALSLFENMHK